MKPIYWNCCSPSSCFSSKVPFRPLPDPSVSPVRAQGAQVSNCRCWNGCVELLGTTVRVEWGQSTLGSFKLEKKSSRSVELPLRGHVYCSSSLCRHQEMYLMIKAKIGLFALLLWCKMRSRIVLWWASCSSLHRFFSVTNGCVGHARGNGPEFIFLSSLWKV